MPGTSPINVASVLPMIHVMPVSGQVSWIERTTARAWQVSPIADRRTTQIFSGGDSLNIHGIRAKVPKSLNETVDKTSNGAIVYDSSIIDQVSEKTFSAAAWKTVRRVDNVLSSGGRGHTLVIGDGRNEFVLRHFRRGGVVGRLINDSYLWLGEDNTRSFAEWRLLYKLVKMGLPVPRPAVARYCRKGPFYTADLITLRIPGIRPLSVRLTEKARSEAFWQSVGAAIRRFHSAGVYHADLSSHNIQIDEDGMLWLLDFDRGRLMPAGTWQQKNLARLHRSLQKTRKLDPRVQYVERNWEQLLEGYFSASRSA